MNTITHRGNTVQLLGDLPMPGSVAPDARLVLPGMIGTSIYETRAEVKVLLCMPSLDTSTCARETRAFNEHLSGMAAVKGVVITLDLPFAMKRFCELEGITNIVPASDFRYKDFLSNYGVEIGEGTLAGLHARAVFILDSNNVVHYSELVADISSEPDYGKALEAITKLTAVSNEYNR